MDKIEKAEDPLILRMKRDAIAFTDRINGLTRNLKVELNIDVLKKDVKLNYTVFNSKFFVL